MIYPNRPSIRPEASSHSLSEEKEEKEREKRKKKKERKKKKRQFIHAITQKDVHNRRVSQTRRAFRIIQSPCSSLHNSYSNQALLCITPAELFCDEVICTRELMSLFEDARYCTKLSADSQRDSVYKAEIAFLFPLSGTAAPLWDCLRLAPC